MRYLGGEAGADEAPGDARASQGEKEPKESDEKATRNDQVDVFDDFRELLSRETSPGSISIAFRTCAARAGAAIEMRISETRRP
jgi:hypothetical protein